MDQGGDAHSFGHVERGAAGIAADPYGGHRLEVANDAPRHLAAFHYFEEHADVPEHVLAVESADGQPLDGVAGRRDAFHFHTAFGTYE